MAQTQSRCLLLPAPALLRQVHVPPLPAAPGLCQAGPQGQVMGVLPVHKRLSWGHPMPKSSQCLVRLLQGDLRLGEHQLPTPMPATPRTMETQVLPGQHQGQGSLVSLPQTWGHLQPPGVGKQPQER